jgi:hypothetical protein
VEAPGGLPTTIPGIKATDFDAVIQRLENIIRDGLQPRLTGVQMGPVVLTSGGAVIVLRIPRSWALPHRVIFGGHDKFYGRNLAGKYPLDVPELRALFTLSESLAERIRSFRAGRLSAILSGETPIPLIEGPKTVLHLVPLTAFTPGISYPVVNLADEIGSLPPIYSGGWSHRLNFDGLLTFSGEPGQYTSYLQIFRNGCIEAVNASLIREHEGKKLISGNYWEKELLDALAFYLNVLKRLDIQPPVVLMLSLLGVHGYTMWMDWGRNADPIDRDNLVIPEILLETLDVDRARAMRPIFDALWNATGLPQSTSYDEQGQWKRQR